MKFESLFQDPLSDSDAPYADTMLLDQGGMTVSYGGEAVAHVSFEDLDPFELAYHAMPDDFEPHPEYDMISGQFYDLTEAELLENHIYKMLDLLGKARGWKRL